MKLHIVVISCCIAFFSVGNCDHTLLLGVFCREPPVVQSSEKSVVVGGHEDIHG